MRKAFSWLLVLIVCFSLCDSQEHFHAEDLSENIPLFNAHLNWHDAAKVADRAAEGDREAIALMRKGRLAYVPILLRVGIRDPRNCLGHEMLREELDWVRDMQRWEVTLAGMNPEAISREWDQLKDRFRESEPQLARAIIAVGLLGDSGTRDALAARAPESPWTRAALAQVGVPAAPRARAEALASAMPLIFGSARYDMTFSLGGVDARLMRHAPFSDGAMAVESDLLFTTDGVERLRTVPAQWNWHPLVGELGTLCAQIGDAGFTRRMQTAVRTAYAEGVEVPVDDVPEVFAHYFRLAALDEALPEPFSGHFSQHMLGPAMKQFVDSMDGKYPLAARFGALTAYQSAPHWGPGRRMMLEEVQRMRDPVLTRMAVRAVLAHNDDCLDAIADIAATLREPEDRKRFQAALEATRNRDLTAVARQLASGRPIPARPWRQLGLSVSHRASLVTAFADESELKASGGELPVYLMNLAAFKFTRNGLYDGVRAYAEAIEASARALKVERGFAAANEAWEAIVFTADGPELESALRSVSRSHPLAYRALRFEQACWTGTPPSDASDDELTNFRMQRMADRGRPPDSSELEAAEANPARSGGSGLMSAGFAWRLLGDARGCNRAWAKSEHATPLNFLTWTGRSSLTERMGVYWGMNWFDLERVGVAMTLLRPNLMHTLLVVSSLFARSGEPPFAVGAMLTSGLLHAMGPRYMPDSFIRFTYLHFARSTASDYLARFTTLYRERIEYQVELRGTFRFIVWGYDPWTPLEGLGIMGLHGHFCIAYVQAELSTRNARASLYLDFANETSRISHPTALRLVEIANELGVSHYGYFVGSQSYIRANAAVGDVAKAFERYAELREGDVGHPPYLDRFLLHGLAEGNRHQHLERAVRLVERHRRGNTEGIEFAYRRALMALERHSQIRNVPAHRHNSRILTTHNLSNYSELFHEAPAMLQAEAYGEVIRRAGVFWRNRIDSPDTIGPQADASLLFAIARKLIPVHRDVPIRTEDGRFDLVGRDVPDDFPQSPWLLDLHLLRILAGLEEPDSLQLGDPDWHWHGSRYSERPFVDRGTAILTAGQCAAREQFIHGVLWWLMDDFARARGHLTACVEADERFSHEYHVAKWLLAHHMGE